MAHDLAALWRKHCELEFSTRDAVRAEVASGVMTPLSLRYHYCCQCALSHIDALDHVLGCHNGDDG